MATCFCCRLETADGDAYTPCRDCRGRCRRGEDCRVRPPRGWVEFAPSAPTNGVEFAEADCRGQLSWAGARREYVHKPTNSRISLSITIAWCQEPRTRETYRVLLQDANAWENLIRRGDNTVERMADRPAYYHTRSGATISDRALANQPWSAARWGPVGATEFARADCTGELSWNTNRRCYLHVPTGQEISLERANSYRNSPDGQAAYREHLSVPAAWRWLIGRGDNSVERPRGSQDANMWVHLASAATITDQMVAAAPSAFAGIDRSVDTRPLAQQPQGDMVDAMMYAYRNITGSGYERQIQAQPVPAKIEPIPDMGAEYRIATPAELARINAQADANWKAAKTCSVAWMRGLIGICSWVRPMPRWAGFYSKGRLWAVDHESTGLVCELAIPSRCGQDTEFGNQLQHDRHKHRRWLGWRGLSALGAIGKACAVVYQNETVQRGMMLEMR